MIAPPGTGVLGIFADFRSKTQFEILKMEMRMCRIWALKLKNCNRYFLDVHTENKTRETRGKPKYLTTLGSIKKNTTSSVRK